MNHRSARTTSFSTKPLPLALAALLGVATLAYMGGAVEPSPPATDRPGHLSTRQVHQQLGELARFSIMTGDPDAPTSWRHGASRDPNTWERVPVVATDREDIVAVRMDGSIIHDERYLVPPDATVAITDREVEILSTLPTLRSVELLEVEITPAQVITLATHPHLQVLTLQSRSVTNDVLQGIGRMKNLRVLAVRKGQIDATGLRHLQSLRNLVALELSGTALDDTTLAGVSDMPWLRFLRLGGDLTDAGFVHLAPLQSLEGLRVDHGNVEGTGLKHLRPDTLRELTLSRTMSDDGLITVGRFTNLRELNIGGSRITDKGIAGLRNLRKLERLSVARASVTGAGLDYLTALRWGEFRGAGITSEGMKSFAGLVELEYLGLDGTRIDSDALKHLRGLRNLVKLGARRTKIGNESLRDLDSLHSLEHLDLSWCSELDDGAAPFLGKMTSLKFLELEETKMTEAALLHFKGLRNLKGLSFPDNTGNVRDSEEFKSLQLALPELRISVSPSFGR